MPEQTIDLRGAITKSMNPAFRPLVYAKERKLILIGGASSSKSYSTAQKWIYKILTEDGHKLLVVRKVARTLRHSCFDLLVAIIKSWNLGDLFRITDMQIVCKVNGNIILFSGLDDVEKLKSIHGVTDIWVEEASEALESDFNQLDLRLRGETKNKKQIVLTLNPISAQHWIKKRFFDRKEADTLTHKSTYKDNIKLDIDTIKNLEAITDKYFKDVYVLGNWGVYGNVVFSNFIIEDFDYTENDLENVSTGMDFGFVHASAVERCGEKDNDLYFFDELYGKGWTNTDFIKYTDEQFGIDSHGWYINADSAEPDRIEEFNRAGFINLEPAHKGPGSLGFGISYLCSKRIHVHATKCPNLARELQSYKRREDKDGNALDSFVEINDDCIAAARYATERTWRNPYNIYTPSAYSAGDLGM